MAEFAMPSLGADMDEGTLVEWRVKPGQAIRKGEIIAVVDTAKSAIEVESFHTGVVGALLVGEGETVPVGTPLATIAEGGEAGQVGARAAGAAPSGRVGAAGRGEAAGEAEAAAGVEPAAGAGAVAGPGAGAPLAAPAGRVTPLVRRVAERLHVDLATVAGTGRGGAVTRADVERTAAGLVPDGAPGPAPGTARRRVSPLARRVAAELGVELGGVTGTGPSGAVRAEDVRRAAREAGAGQAAAAEAGEQAAVAAAGAQAAGAQGPGAAAGEAGPLAAEAHGERALAMRQAIGRLMARSKREIPHYYLANTIDLGPAVAWLRERNRDLPMSGRLVPAALLLKATALAARAVPDVNGYWRDDRFEAAPAVHLGVATSLRGGGLVTPALHNADRLPLGTLMALLRDLVKRARGGRLRRTELTEATITVTNLGDQGVESVTGVIYPPQVALVGFGKVVERPWAVDGLLGVRPVVVSTLAADHRATDGYTGARFLAAIEELLRRPEDL